MKYKTITNIFTPSHQEFIISAAKNVANKLNANFVGSYGKKTIFKKNKFVLNQLEMLEGKLQNNRTNFYLKNAALELKEIEKNIIKRNNESKYKLKEKDLENLKGRITSLWEYLINRYNINCILFEDIPHQISDWILYDIAIRKKIICVGLVPILGSKGLFSWTRYNRPGIIARNCINGLKNNHIFKNERVLEYIKNLETITHKESVNRFLHDQNLDFIFKDNSKVYNSKKVILKKELKKSVTIYAKRFKDYFRKFKYKNHYPTDIWLVNFDKNYKTNYEQYLDEIEKSNLKKRKNFNIYKKLSISFNEKRFQKFVIVCLQFQPEVSTTPLAYPFDDIYFFIKNLRKNLSKQITILIKEHPSQFCEEYTRYPEFWRDKNLYNNINNLHNTYFLDMDTDLFFASKNSLCIFNFGGNIGCEMILREQHIANIGNSWYYPAISNHVITNEKELESYAKNIYKKKKLFDLNSNKYKEIFYSMCKYSCFGIGGSFGIKEKKEFLKMNKIDEKQNSELISQLYIYEIKNIP